MSEGAYYYLPENPQPVELLANPPYATGTDYDAACGSGAWLVEAANAGTHVRREAGMPKTVYLAGPIHGMTDLECKQWRNEAAALLGVHDVEVLDPMDRDFRGREDEVADELVEADKGGIEQCGVVLVNANQPGWGTAMEVFYAKSLGKLVIAFTNADSISPWLRCHTSAIFGTLHEAIAGIVFGECAGMR